MLSPSISYETEIAKSLVRRDFSRPVIRGWPRLSPTEESKNPKSTRDGTISRRSPFRVTGMPQAQFIRFCSGPIGRGGRRNEIHAYVSRFGLEEEASDLQIVQNDRQLKQRCQEIGNSFLHRVSASCCCGTARYLLMLGQASPVAD
jgi:hypothetical protein